MFDRLPATAVSNDVEEVADPVSVDAHDLIGVFRRPYESLTLQESGEYEYSSSPGCMYSYMGYKGRWEIQRNLVVLRQGQPDECSQALHVEPSDDPFMELKPARLNGEVVLGQPEDTTLPKYDRGPFRRVFPMDDRRAGVVIPASQF